MFMMAVIAHFFFCVRYLYKSFCTKVFIVINQEGTVGTPYINLEIRLTVLPWIKNY